MLVVLTNGWVETDRVRYQRNAVRKIECGLEIVNEIIDYKSCLIEYQKIDDDGFTIDGELDDEIENFKIDQNKEVGFLPEKIAEILPRLTRYVARDCAIKHVNEKHFEKLHELEDLNLNENEIDSIAGDSFKDLKKLKVLSLSGNRLRLINPKWFETMKKLQKFSVNSNQVKHLHEGTFGKLTNLHQIDLSYNKLSSLEKNLFNNNSKLQDIKLNNNNLEIIPSTTFDRLNRIKFVALEQNVCVNQHYGNDPNCNGSQNVFDVIQMKKFLMWNCTRLLVTNESHRPSQLNILILIKLLAILRALS